MKLSKKDINTLLDFYSVKKDEFKCIDTDNKRYEHTKIKGYWITLKCELENDIVTVTHTDASGKVRFYDLWKRSGETYSFEGRNLPEHFTKEDNLQLMEYRKECYELRSKNSVLERKAKDRETYYFENIKLQDENKFLTAKLKLAEKHKNANSPSNSKELEQLKKQYEVLKEKYEHIGRPKKLSGTSLKSLEDSIRNNETPQSICKKFNISRASYFRLKKEMNKENH